MGRAEKLIRVVLTTAWFVCWYSWPAYGDPISIGAFFTGLSAGFGGTIALVPFTGAAAAGFAIGSFAASIGGSLLLNAALAVGSALLTGAFNRPPTYQSSTANPGSRLVNLRQGLQDRTRGYGLYRTGGPVFFWKLSGGKRYVGVALNTDANGINSFEDVYFGERVGTFDGSGYATNTEYQSNGSSVIQIEKLLGAPGQTAPALLLNNFTEWTSAHKLTSVAAIVCAFANTKPEDFSTAYPDGREPTVTALIKAANVYDPRLDSTNGGTGTHRADDPTTWEWTTNAALIIADWCVHADGLGATVSDAWWQLVATEADVADTIVLDRDGNSIPKWQLCGSYSLNEPRENVRNSMALSCDAFFYETDAGEPAFFLGRYIEPDVTITDEDIYSAAITEGQEGTDIVNAVSVQFTSPAAGYREDQTTPFYEDNGSAYQEETARAFWVPNHNQGVRVAKRILRAASARYRGTLKLKLRGLLLRGKRFFRLEFATLGISQTFEILDWKFAGMDETGAGFGLYIDVQVVSVTQEDFAFVAATEEPAPSTIADVVGDTTTPAPTGAVLSSTVAGSLFMSFDAAPRDSLTPRMRYREVGATDWLYQDGSIGVNYIAASGIPFGNVYEADVEFRTSAGRESAWTTPTPSSVTVASTTATPPSVTFNGPVDVSVAGEATFNWTAPDDPAYFGTRIYIDAANDFATAHAAGIDATEYGMRGDADSAAVTIAAGTYYAWLVAINSNDPADEATEIATGSFTVT